MIAALLWDVDGTLAETERDGHREAFNRAFEDVVLPWRWSVAHDGDLHARKNRHYPRCVASGGLKLRDGVRELIDEAASRGVPVVVTRSVYVSDATVEGVLAVGPGLHSRQGWTPAPLARPLARVGLDDLIDWHSRMDLVSRFD